MDVSSKAYSSVYISLVQILPHNSEHHGRVDHIGLSKICLDVTRDSGHCLGHSVTVTSIRSSCCLSHPRALCSTFNLHYPKLLCACNQCGKLDYPILKWTSMAYKSQLPADKTGVFAGLCISGQIWALKISLLSEFSRQYGSRLGKFLCILV
jgi:hypothetical protein